MLRGKFGQIGTKLRDGHIVMDAFQQAAFRDHIRSGERIMLLASMGQLKHKRTRNTIAAEPTPRSSCPSKADSITTPPPAGDITNSNGISLPVTTAEIEITSAETASAGVRTPEATPIRSPNAMGFETSRSRSGPCSPMSSATGLDSNSDRDGGGRKPNSEKLLAAAEFPSAGRLGKERGISSADYSVSSLPRRASQRGNISPNHRQLDRRIRPRSAGPGGRRPRPLGVVSVTRRLQADATTTTTTTTRQALVAATPVGDVPLHVGPEISPTRCKGPVARGAAPGVSSSSVTPPRPASAGGCRQPGTGWRSARPGPTRVVHRALGDKSDGGGGVRAVCRKGGKRTHAKSKARVAAGDDELSLGEQGSFAASVTKSARPFADYDDDVDNDEWPVIPAPCGRGGRPRSANAAVKGSTSATAFDPRYPTANALAADTRFMPVRAIDKGFQGHRLAAVQAWDPHTAAAVRAARAETFLRRALISRATEAPVSAAAQPRTRLQAVAAAAAAGVVERVGGSRHGSGQWAPPPRRTPVDGRVKSLGTRARVASERASCSSPQSTSASSTCRRELKRSSARGSTKSSTISSSPTLSTARTSTATTCSSRENGSSRASSRRSKQTNDNIGVSSSDDVAAEERRTRLLVELETLRRRMEDAESLLLKVDSSLLLKQRRRPRTATHRASRKHREHSSSGRRASTVATVGNTSAKSSAGYGAFNLGERCMCPLVVTHSANDFLDQL